MGAGEERCDCWIFWRAETYERRDDDAEDMRERSVGICWCGCCICVFCVVCMSNCKRFLSSEMDKDCRLNDVSLLLLSLLLFVFSSGAGTGREARALA